MHVAWPTGLGSVIALVVLVVVIVLALMGRLELTVAGLLMGLALARLC